MPAYSAGWITFQTFAIDKSWLYYIRAKCEYVIAQSIFNPLSSRLGSGGSGAPSIALDLRNIWGQLGHFAGTLRCLEQQQELLYECVFIGWGGFGVT